MHSDEVFGTSGYVLCMDVCRAASLFWRLYCGRFTSSHVLCMEVYRAASLFQRVYCERCAVLLLYVCTCIHECVRIHAYMFMYTCMHVYVYMCTYVHMYVRTYMHVHSCMCMYRHLCITKTQ